MKKILLLLIAIFSLQLTYSQTQKKFELYVVAEGNFGTPNGDLFKVTNSSETIIQEGPLYQNANSGAIGFDVLQDFQIVGNKAVLLSKSSGFRVVVANYPSLTHVQTFTGLGAPQTLSKGGENKAYLSSSNPNKIFQINLENNTTAVVSDPENTITAVSNYMTFANGYVYASISSKIVKIDPNTNAVVATILPNLGTISGLEFDESSNSLWVLGKVSGTSALKKINVANNDLMEETITLTGVTNALYLRYADHKLYFLSGKNAHIYNINAPNIPTTSLYTSTLTGSWDFAYGKAFYVDPISGDFVFGSANAFTSGSKYEIVDGTTFEMIATGTVANCIGVNELILKTEKNLAVETPEILAISIYPNPASDVINFNVRENQYTISIYNQLGNLVKSVESKSEEYKLDVSDLPTGIYFTKIKTINKEFATKKIIIK